MSSIQQSRRRFLSITGSALCAVLMCLWVSCATVPTRPDSSGTVHATVALNGSLTVSPDPIRACFIDPTCKIHAKQVQWDLIKAPAGSKLGVAFEAATGPCKSDHNKNYKRDPGFQAVRCPTDSQCMTVGQPQEPGCYKYDVVVTPPTGQPVRLDPDMIIM